MLSLVALTLFARTVSQHAQVGPGRFPAMGWHVNESFIAGNCGDRNADGRDDYVVCGPDDRVRVFSSADDTEVPSSPEQLARAHEIARRLAFDAGEDPALETSPALEWLRNLPERELARARAIVPVTSTGPRWSERIVISPYSMSHVRWFDLTRSEPRASLLPRTECPFDYAFVADLDRDGVEDVLVRCDDLFDEWTMSSAGVIAFSGKSGFELWRTTFSAPKPQWEYALPGWPNLVSPGDLDGDESPDFVLSVPMNAFAPTVWSSSILAVSGKRGAILWRQDDDKNFGETLGASIALVSDRDGDGVRDVVFARGEKREHELDIVSSKTGAILKRCVP